MEEKITETYTKEEKNLTELIQEWINENTSILYCDYEEKYKISMYISSYLNNSKTRR